MLEILHFHLFCGLGGGARGFGRGRAAVNGLQARYRCIGGVDSDPAACNDFGRLTGVPATRLDLFSAADYHAFHGSQPPAGWREATVADLQGAAGGERPNVVFTSPPCKGFSGLLSQKTAASGKYQALNALTLRGVMLALAAWADDPPEFFLLENVPRVQQRGQDFIRAIRALLVDSGYSVAETVHDCGELGGLAQTRQRFLMVGRHREKVPPFLYEPPRRPLRAVGEVIGPMPLPGDPASGPMHAMRSLEWRTWVRLALIPAGGDWRDLRGLRVEDGELADYGIVPEVDYFRGSMGVRRWGEPAGTVTAEARPQNGAFAIADPRYRTSGEYGQLGVRCWEEPAATVTSQSLPGGGRFSVADPRLHKADRQVYGHAYRVTDWSRPAGTVIGATRPGSGAGVVADPRPPESGPRFNNVFRVIAWGGRAQAVTAGGTPTAGGQAIADPRLAWRREDGDPWAGQRHYGVLPWDASSGAVTAAAKHDNGSWSVADPRTPGSEPGGPAGLPRPDARLVAMIRALDGTWHRPFTTLELAALQGLVEPGELLELDGRSDTAHRQRIGNAVPPPAAAAVSSVIGHALLLAWSGESFSLGCTPIWAKDLAVAVSLEDARQ